LEYIPTVKRFQLRALAYYLYDGSCGIALFLAVLWAVTKDNQYRSLALNSDLAPGNLNVNSKTYVPNLSGVQYLVKEVTPSSAEI
jgi:lantibiotic modifying enzyme